MTKLRPLIKVPNVPPRLAAWVAGFLPEATTYVEPLAGPTPVLFKRRGGGQEIINDPDAGLIMILRVLRDQPAEFVTSLAKVRWGEKPFAAALQNEGDDLTKAVQEVVRRGMSRDGRGEEFHNTAAGRKAWAGLLGGLPAVADRLQGVNLLVKPPATVIKAFDGPTATFLAWWDGGNDTAQAFVGCKGAVVLVTERSARRFTEIKDKEGRPLWRAKRRDGVTVLLNR